MKIFVKLMLFIVVAAVAAPFIIKGPNGRPLMTLDRLHTPQVDLPDFSRAADAVKAGLDHMGDDSDKVKAVFKWQDEKGVWHFSDKVERGQTAQKLSVDPTANLVHFAAAGNSRKNDDQDTGGGSHLVGASPVGAVTKLIGDAKNVEHLQEEHVARRERALQE